MKKKILIILTLIIAISVLCCTVAVAEELPTEQTGESVTVPEESVEETPEETPSQDITDKIAEAGDKALEWFTGITSAVSGVIDISLICAIIAVGIKALKLIKALKSTSFSYEELKVAYNSLIDEFDALKQNFEKYKEQTSVYLAEILTELKATETRNTALCKTLATLINYSNLPDASKENVLGEMNAALGYKSEVSANEKND